MDKPLYDAAKAGSLILTVNDRLARHLSLLYDLEQQKLGLSAWLRPDIMSFATWLLRCQKQLAGLPQFLGNTQLNHVWEQIIKADMQSIGNLLLNVPQTARRARQAHHLLVQYHADFGDEFVTEDHRAFLRWRREWQRISLDRGWCDAIDIPRLLADAIAQGAIDLPDKVILAGFDEITPDQQQLCDSLQARGAAVGHWHPEPCPSPVQVRVSADDPADEVRQCARWIRGLVTENHSAKVAVVVPRLELYQGLIERIFRAELEPHSLYDSSEVSSVFNLSLGHRLDREGVVHAALRLLRLGHVLAHDEVSWVLRTPYTGRADAEMNARAMLDKELRSLRRYEWPLSRLIRLVPRLSGAVDGFAGLLGTIDSDLKKSARRTPGGWAEHFAALLYRLGWPGERSLSSREFQAVRRFRECLAEFASLDEVGGPVDRSEAVNILSGILGACDFQPEGVDAPVQVLGELESAGMTFDHVWVMGLTDTAMPRSPSPNPFIPLHVQKQCRMKRADAEREHQFAVRVVSRLFSAAPDIVVSWPKQDNGAPQRPSPFIAGITDGHPVLHDSCAPETMLWRSRPQLERLVDDHGTPISVRKPFSGGTGIIKDQALCPFRAFAHHRLRAEQFDSADIGIDSMSRGTLVHTVLELFWDEVKDQSALMSLDESMLGRLIDTAVEGALDRLEREQRSDIPVKQRKIERDRLVILARQWLDEERKRGPFEVIAAEKSMQVNIGALQIRTRIDRIDALADDTLAIIDYKTGNPDPLQWLESRITEPQLPIYCLGMERDKVGAVMFAAVRGKEKECGFRGFARNQEEWPGTRTRKIAGALEEKGWGSFDEIISHWESALPELGDAFAKGQAKVDPVDREIACKYCDLKGFCRIDEKRSEWSGGNDD